MNTYRVTFEGPRGGFGSGNSRETTTQEIQAETIETGYSASHLQ